MQQQALEETTPIHTTIQLNNIELQYTKLLQPYPTSPTSETSPFQQVPIFEYDNIDYTVSEEKSTDEMNEPLIIQDDHSLALVPANASNTLAYHQLQGGTQSQFIISLSLEVSQLLDSNIPQQLSISYNPTNTHNTQLVQLYNTLIALFASYIHSNNIGAELSSLEEEKDHNTNPFHNNNSCKHLHFHDTLQEIVPIQLPPDFLQQCDGFHQYDILHSIIKYVRNFLTQISVNLVENIFHIWPQYIVLVDSFIEWADKTKNFSRAELYYTENYDLLADSLEDQIYTIANNIHKRIQTVSSRYYKRHRLILNDLTTIPHILRETIYFLQVSPDKACENYQDSLIIQEVQYLFQDDQELETIKTSLIRISIC